MQSDHTTLFKSRWDAYQWSLDNDVLGHKDVLQKARLLIETVVCDQPINILDLGCGNSAPVIELISHLHLVNYYGTDLAENALQEAKSLTDQLAIPVRFFRRNLFEGIPASLNINFIFSSSWSAGRKTKAVSYPVSAGRQRLLLLFNRYCPLPIPESGCLH